MIVNFIKFIVLMRLLPVDIFGVYATALSIVMISVGITDFGMGSAFMHHCKETNNVEKASKVHFTLKFIFLVFWSLLLFMGMLIFTSKTQIDFRLTFTVLILSTFGNELTKTPRIIRKREINHKRIAMIKMLDVSLSLIIAVFLASKNMDLWALLSSNIITALLYISFLYLWNPVWLPKFGLEKDIVRYFINFGLKSVTARFLIDVLDRVDDLWTAMFLGKTAIGYYSKAYQLASYPASIISNPISPVATGIYAELKKDKNKLSEAYFLINAVLVRSGFFLAGLLALVSKDLILIVLTEKWLPILEAFRYMLIFTLFDPMIKTVSSLFIAIGKPEIIIKIRFYQLISLIVSLFIFGFVFNIGGVALATDIMLTIGIVKFLHKSKSFVDISINQLFLIPSIAIFTGLLAGIVSRMLEPIFHNNLAFSIFSGCIFTTVYLIILYLFDKKQLARIYSAINDNIINCGLNIIKDIGLR